MDVHTIIDSIADIMSHEDKELCKYGHMAITVLYETVSIVMQDQLKAARLPFFEYMAGKSKHENKIYNLNICVIAMQYFN